ncbi:MAG: SGNH/GDSL hydrolase family protein [Planctomycetia bacterium]|jgi:acyl-CoA thioesterase-1
MPASKSPRVILVLTILVSLFLCLSLTAQAKKAKKAKKLRPEYRQAKEDPNLPRVLILGDSISIGYMLPTRAYLKGVANVQRPATNCGPTTKGLKELDEWLGEKPWDMIHFNFGLHDLKYVDEKGKTVKKLSDGAQQVPIEQYEKNLEEIVQRLKKTDAVLIWRTTTPVPKGSKGRVSGDAAKYNEAALRVMKKHDIPVHDLYKFCLPRLEKIQRPANVHFTKKGSKILGKDVAEKIKEQLDKKSEQKTE